MSSAYEATRARFGLEGLSSRYAFPKSAFLDLNRGRLTLFPGIFFLSYLLISAGQVFFTRDTDRENLVTMETVVSGCLVTTAAFLGIRLASLLPTVTRYRLIDAAVETALTMGIVSLVDSLIPRH